MSHFDIMGAPAVGSHLIDASAGTGKTYTISGLVTRMIVEYHWPIEKILVVTFTEAAASDLKSRIRGMMMEAAIAFRTTGSEDPLISRLVSEISDHQKAVRLLNIALQNFDEASIFTIHGFCQKILRDNFLECGTLLDSELVTDQWRVIREISEDFYRTNFYEASPLFVAYCQQNLLPEKLRKFLGVYHSRDDIDVIPEIDRNALDLEIEQAVNNFREKFATVTSAWSLAQEEIEKILMQDAGLNRTSYPLKSVPAWISSFDRMASLSRADISLFDKFHKFSAATVQKSTKKGFASPQHDIFFHSEELLRARDAVVALFEKQVVSYKKDLYDYVRSELEIRKKAGGYYTFDDMLKGLSLALKGRNGRLLSRTVAEKYRAALIDEFQDTDPIQYEIFHEIFSGKNSLLFLIGDPKQSIYSFRGADVFAYMKAVREVDSRFTLDHNWRSVPGLINATNTIFANCQRPFIFKDIFFESAQAAKKEHDLFKVDSAQQAPFQLIALEREETDPQLKLLGKEVAKKRILCWMVYEVKNLIALGQQSRAMVGDKPLSAGDIAILVRTNREARETRRALSQAGVASVLHSSESLFVTREAEELLLVLQALAEPGDSRKVRTALATRLLGKDGSELDILGEVQGDIFPWIERFKEYHEIWLTHGFGFMFGRFLSKENVFSRLLRLEGGERVVTNLLHMDELLYRISVDRGLGVVGLCKYLTDSINETAADVPDEHQLRLESDAELVQIVTIHKSKGLQYPIVFCPFCWQGSRMPKIKNGRLPVDSNGFLYHDSVEGPRLTLDIGSSDILASRDAAFREERAESLRLLYVALTRAIHRCYLFWGPINEAGSSAPAYLLHGHGNGEDAEYSPDSQDILAILTDEEIRNDLMRLVVASGGDIELQGAGVPASPISMTSHEPGRLSRCPEFSGWVDSSWRVSSFSSIAAAHYTLGGHSLKPVEDRETGDREFFADFRNFPRGPGPGTFLHSLLEGLDFTTAFSDTGAEWVRKCLVRAGYDAEWQAAICEMLSNVLKAPLQSPHGEVCLSTVECKDRLDELEFYFPLEGLDQRGVASLFSDVIGINPSGISVPNFKGESIRGFMKGYIDLVFCHSGRFHIIDWKSNHLGFNDDGYATEELAKVMIDKKYSLQYLIYTVALHRYLEQRLSGYDYEKHFGGVHYLFLRGVSSEAGDSQGIYHVMPDKKMVTKAARIMTGVE